MTHLAFLAVFAIAVGIVLGAMLRRGRDRIARLAVRIAAALVIAAIVLAWIMYFLPLDA